MGLLRLFLALSVVAAHAGSVFGYVGVGGGVAVQAFFIVSGFYMALVLHEKYREPDQLLSFYVARFLRIYAIYWPILGLFLLAASATFLMSGGGPLETILRQGTASLAFLLLAVTNVTLLGLDLPLFFEFTASGITFSTDAINPETGLVPGIVVGPAWTLSLELAFYAMAPFLVRRKVSTLIGLMLICVGARWAFYYFLDLSGQPWSYRFFPFELPHFLAGALAYRLYAKRTSIFGPRDMAVIVALVVALVPYQLWGDVRSNAFYFAPARVLGLALVALSLPSLFLLTRNSNFDRSVGELSYPIYLLHMLIVPAVGRIGALEGSPWAGPLIVVSSLAAAIIFETIVGVRMEQFRVKLVRRLASRPARNSVGLTSTLAP